MEPLGQLKIVLIEPDSRLGEPLCSFLRDLGHTAVLLPHLNAEHGQPDAYPDHAPAPETIDLIIWAIADAIEDIEDDRLTGLGELQRRYGRAEILLAVPAALIQSPRVMGKMAEGVTDYVLHAPDYLLHPYHHPTIKNRLDGVLYRRRQSAPTPLQASVESNSRLNQANQALARVFELQDVLQAIVTNIPAITADADGALICFYNFATNRFELDKTAGWGLGTDQITWPTTRPQPHSLLHRVLEDGLATVLTPADFQKLPRPIQSELDKIGIHSFIGLRLRAGAEPLGALFINYKAPYRRAGLEREEEIGRLKLYADQAAFAMERAYLFERNRQERQLLQDALTAIRTGKGFEESAWAPVLDEAMEITGAERGVIILMDGLTFTFHVKRGFSTDYEATNSELNQRILAHIAKHKKVIWVQDLPQESQWASLQETNSTARSILAVPIIDKQNGPHETGEVVGIINLKSSQPQAFDTADRELAKQFAERAELALNAVYTVRRSLDSETQRLKAVYTAAKLINQAGSNAQTVLQAILDEARRITNSYFGTLQLISEDHEYLEFVAASPAHHWDELIHKLPHMPLHGPGISTWAARENDAKLVTNTAQEPRFVESPGGPTGSELVVVVRDEFGEPMGVLNVEHRQPHGLTAEDRSLLVSLADLLTIVFKNATYRQELSEAKSELATVEALAWRGLFGSNWWHSAAQESGVIKWTVRRLRRQVPDGAHKLLDQIIEAAQKIESMPAFNWLPEGVKNTAAPLPIDHALQTHIEELCKQKPFITLKFDLHCKNTYIQMADPFLELALEKLIDNALRAMNDKGTLSISSHINHGQVRITLEDDGPGVPEAYRDDYLKRPIPKTPEERGSGLGGLIARFVFERHGGHIEPTYLPLRGTRITITLPIVGDSP